MNMNNLENVNLGIKQQEAIAKLRKKLLNILSITSIILFGSYCRNEEDDESDIDLLIITEQILNRSQRHQITDIVFEINLEYGTNFSTLVVDHDSWETGYFTVLPIKQEILKDGIRL
ncbi:MAG: hypothetical protein A2161_06690 [Candidatus Schekmanbacteria bacterium RBG_13_48_7]|uniref:Polymerase nucleotidyl transferase domain-containing protein n=1 Tax=Candidatus Schekmanbacteria bacterium RBG_13_48_7 TaxID=1817878 RepID=A0A1F7RMP6_9BACT|nr:MAG: hypothetical protein A2161_06690 [Candidatus Schekmanbacteria bacterium RBG_13_48_7]